MNTINTDGLPETYSDFTHDRQIQWDQDGVIHISHVDA